MITILYYPDSTTHCAIALTGLEQDSFYLSFMPNDIGGGFRLHKMEDDFKHRATRVVNIPSEESSGYGLSEAAILHWYQTKFTRNPGFNHFTYNCATVVYEALIVGQTGSRSLGAQVVEKKNWWFDLPSKIMNYASNLVTVVQAKHKEYLDKQNDWLHNKILEMENLYSAAATLPKNEFIYSYFIKAIEISTCDTTQDNYKEALKNKFIQSFLRTLAGTNIDTVLQQEIKEAFAIKNQNKLLKLSLDVYQYNFNPTASTFKNVLSFFNVGKSVNSTNYTRHLKTLIDDNNNIYKAYFVKPKTSAAVIGNYYRR